MTEITQADKNRADQWLDRPSDTPARKSERDRLAHKFARHREQAEQETVAKIVAWLRNRKEMTERYIDYVETAQAADCIEAGEWK